MVRSYLIVRRLPNYTDTEPIPRHQILDSSKLKNFSDNNFKFDESDKVLQTGKNTVGKGAIVCNFSFSRGVFKRPILQTP